MSFKFFRKIFNLDLSKKATRKGIRRKLELLNLEERVVPATFTVLNTNDFGQDSLRDAITLANTTAGDDIINFSFGSGSSPYTITLASALPSIVDASSTVGAGTAGTLTITGLGASSLTIDANQGDFNIFKIDPSGDLSISGVTVTGVNRVTSQFGGGFYNFGILTVNNSIIFGNTVNQGSSGSGGGIYNQGTLTVSNSTLSGNSAGSFGGGGIKNDGTLTVTNCTLSGNTATSKGGGILNTGTLNIANTIIANSTSGGDYASNGGTIVTNLNNLVEDASITDASSTSPGSGNISGDPLLGPLANNGGPTLTLALLPGSPAIAAGDATISNAPPINGLDQRGVTRITSDIGAFSLGIVVTTTADTIDPTDNLTSLREAITLANTTAGNDQISFNLTGTSPYTITLTAALPNIIDSSTAITGGTAGTITITGLGASSLTIDANQGNFSIFTINTGGNLSISGVTVTGAQTSGSGGAFKNNGSLTVSNSTISGNSATTGGGIQNNTGGALTITSSTLSSNTATFGGGIENRGISTITNSTISGNSASQDGGGIINPFGGTFTLDNSTISGNLATLQGGGIVNGGTFTISNSTVASNSAATGGGIFINSNVNGSTLTITIFHYL